ncbi:unnamed protein product [Discosporangium mesarthrocarpum]
MFPGDHERCAEIQIQVTQGIGDPPNPLALAIAQAVLACLKCGWTKGGGTNTLDADVCFKSTEGDERMSSYSKSWGLNKDQLNSMLVSTWSLIDDPDEDNSDHRHEQSKGEVEGEGEQVPQSTPEKRWAQLRSTWTKLEQMFKSQISRREDQPVKGGRTCTGDSANKREDNQDQSSLSPGGPQHTPGGPGPASTYTCASTPAPIPTPSSAAPAPAVPSQGRTALKAQRAGARGVVEDGAAVAVAAVKPLRATAVASNHSSRANKRPRSSSSPPAGDGKGEGQSNPTRRHRPDPPEPQRQPSVVPPDAPSSRVTGSVSGSAASAAASAASRGNTGTKFGAQSSSPATTTPSIVESEFGRGNPVQPAPRAGAGAGPGGGNSGKKSFGVVTTKQSLVPEGVEVCADTTPGIGRQVSSRPAPIPSSSLSVVSAGNAESPVSNGAHPSPCNGPRGGDVANRDGAPRIPPRAVSAEGKSAAATMKSPAGASPAGKAAGSAGKTTDDLQAGQVRVRGEGSSGGGSGRAKAEEGSSASLATRGQGLLPLRCSRRSFGTVVFNAQDFIAKGTTKAGAA